MVTWLGTACLVLWIPFILVMFYRFPPKQAVVFCMVSGWMGLPTVGIAIIGFPDFTKYTVTPVGIALAAFMFDRPRLTAFRPRWIDLPLLVWCLGYFPTAISNDLGPYDGMSTSVSNAIMYGLPYLIGRVYLGDREGMRLLATALVVAGLVYVPFCAWEIRMSPRLQSYLFLVKPMFEPPRYGLGYRPIVMLGNQLETGMMMSMIGLTAFWMWFTKSLRSLWGFPGWMVMLTLVGTALLCKSVGAILLLGAGVVCLLVVWRTKTLLPVLMLAAVAPAYAVLRTTNMWSGREIVSLSETYLGGDRAGSFRFRLDNEDILIDKAMKRPWLGWGGFSRSRVTDEVGRDISVTDGFWVIVLGIQGVVGLSAMTASFTLPILRLVRKLPARSWWSAAEAPVAAIGVMTVLHLIDDISNAFVNPVYMVALGGIASYTVEAGSGGRREDLSGSLARAGGLAASGDLDAAGAAYLDIIEDPDVASWGSALDHQAVGLALRGLADVRAAAGLEAEAHEALVASVDHWRRFAGEHPGAEEPLEGLAESLDALGRFMKERRHWGEAAGFMREALGVREQLASAGRGDAGYADALNDLSWLLTFCEDPEFRDPSAAVAMAEQAVEASPRTACYWNTLGAAYAYTGAYASAVPALTRAVELGGGGTAFDHYLMALACGGLGDGERAREWFDRAEVLVARDPVHTPELERCRADAASALGPAPADPTNVPT